MTYSKDGQIKDLVSHARRISNAASFDHIHTHEFDLMVVTLILEGMLKLYSSEQLEAIEQHLKGFDPE